MAEHPRHHALTIAAAQHLHSAGHISMGQRDAIHRDARKKLDRHKASKAKIEPPAFGSIAPSGAPPMGPLPKQGAGHYMSTVNPGTSPTSEE